MTRDDFFPKESLQLAEVKGLDVTLQQALDFKYITKPMTKQDVAGLFDMLAARNADSRRHSKRAELEVGTITRSIQVIAQGLSIPDTASRRSDDVESSGSFHLCRCDRVRQERESCPPRRKKTAI